MAAVGRVQASSALRRATGSRSSLLNTAAMYTQVLRTRCAELRPSFHPLPTAQPASLNSHSHPHQPSVRPSILSPDALTSTTCCSTKLPAMQVPLCAPLSAQSQNHVTLLCTYSRATSSVHAVQNRLPPMLLRVGTLEMRKVKVPGLGNSRYPTSQGFVGKISGFTSLSL